ncbi:transposase [Mycobacteroides abscessus subsp. abscessus]|nr:transposase [Mycobacteroides abscessus subsp. abscessus]
MVEQRYQAVLTVISDGLSISQVAFKVEVSRQTLHVWLARYEAQGLEGWRIGCVDRRAVRIRCQRRGQDRAVSPRPSSSAPQRLSSPQDQRFKLNLTPVN